MNTYLETVNLVNSNKRYMLFKKKKRRLCLRWLTARFSHTIKRTGGTTTRNYCNNRTSYSTTEDPDAENDCSLSLNTSSLTTAQPGLCAGITGQRLLSFQIAKNVIRRIICWPVFVIFWDLCPLMLHHLSWNNFGSITFKKWKTNALFHGAVVPIVGKIWVSTEELEGQTG